MFVSNDEVDETAASNDSLAEINNFELFGNQEDILNILDEITTEIAQKRNTSIEKDDDITKRSKGNSESLLTNLLRKHNELIKICHQKDAIIDKQNRELRIANERIRRLQKTTNQAELHSELDCLEAKCTELDEQLKEMERFLNAHGLDWGRTKRDQMNLKHILCGSVEIDSSRNLDRSEARDDIFDKIISRVESLNQTVLGDQLEIMRDTRFPNQAYFSDRSDIPLTLYANGLILHNRRFRAYSDPIALNLIEQLLDGIFPEELQAEFPNGIKIKLIDLRDKLYVNNDESHQLRDDTETKANNLPIFGKCRQPTSAEFDIHRHAHLEPLTFDDLLQRLPKNVIGKSGRIISIRDEIREKIMPSPRHEQVDLCSIPDAQPSCSEVDFVTLKVRSLDGTKFYNLRLASTDTIEQLYGCLDAVCPPTQAYHLVTLNCSTQDGESSVTRRVILDQMHMTIGQAGLVSRTLLQMVPLQGKDVRNKVKISAEPAGIWKPSIAMNQPQ